MKIKDLPSGGAKFRTNIGAGNFSKKLNTAMRAGELKNLGDNKEAVIKTIKRNERAIRLGNFNRLRQIKAMSDIKKSEGARLTKDDKRDIKKIFKHLAEGDSKDKGAVSKVKVEKQIDKDESFINQKKEEARNRITRINRTKGGGETRVNINNDPYSPDKKEMNTTAKLLQRHYSDKEDRVAQKLPRFRVNWEEERGKRFEASSLEADRNKKPDNNAKDDLKSGDKPKVNYESFQNL